MTESNQSIRAPRTGTENTQVVSKMIPAFAKAEGGLFGNVLKADVGDAVSGMGDVTLMSWADPFYPDRSTPEHVVRAAVRALEEGPGGHYTPPVGSAALKEAIARRFERRYGLKLEPQRNILITPGSDSGLFFAILPFLREGDEVLIPDPSYPNNTQDVEILGGVPVRVPLKAEYGFQPRAEDFAARITPKTKMVILTNPNNPTTTVIRRENLEALCRLIVEHDLVLVVDQAFEEPVFDGIEMVAAASLPGMWERTLTVCSLSKGMGLSGYRVGYIITDDRIMDKLYGCTVAVLGAPNTAAQYGAIAAMEDDSFMENISARLLERRNLVYEKLSGIPGVTIYKSESGFLSWLDVSRLGTDAEVTAYLRDHARVSVNPGTPYGPEGAGHLRIVHGVLGSDDRLEDCLDRIAAALRALAAEKGIQKEG